MENSTVNDYTYIDGSIIGWKAKVGKWCRLEGLNILGEDVSINNEISLNSTIVLPNVGVKNSQTNPGTIILF